MPIPRPARTACLIAAGCAIVFVCFRRPDEARPREALDTAAMREFARLGEGLLVWERRVKGRWQIWMRALDGRDEPQRLVPEEPGRDHFCPKLSPDGRRLAYMSYARGTTPYEPVVGSLWMLDLATRGRTQLAGKARSYFEDRAVIWFDNDRLCHVDDRGAAVELDVRTMESKPLTDRHRRHGWLVNAQKTHATSGEPEFPTFDAATGKVQDHPKHFGCQPYFSSDGRWGFWMGGPGGPINRMFLPTRMVGHILDHEDPRLPSGQNYIYFPMLSPCRRLMAFAASRNEHDHFTADFDLFVARVDADTLEVIGKPVRCTDSPDNDRFPDVFCSELPLGSRFVEGDSVIVFTAPDGIPCDWRVNGSSAGTGEELRHRFAETGDHWVEAVPKDGPVLRGLVHVRAVRAPQLLLVRRAEHGALALTFDEAVSLVRATVKTEDGRLLPFGIQSAE